MSETLARLALRGALWAGLSGLAWWQSGASPVFVFALALGGPLLAGPLLDLVGDLRRQMRQAVWGPVEGRHFAYRGTPVQVREDVEHRRWIRVADLRRVVGFTSSDATLALTYPAQWHLDAADGSAWLEAEAALVHLGREPGAAAHRFARWLEQEVAWPARRQRERLGIRPAPPDR